MAKLVLEALRRVHPGAGAPALDDVSLSVDEGEVLVLVGPSGCGKSTLLRLVAGLDLPDAGRILLDGRDLVLVPPQDRDVAMVFQGYALYPHMTVRENMAFPLKMRGIKPADRAPKVDEAAAMLGIERLLDRRPAELSGGERQRVAMGRALVRRPKLFLFDEPLSNLDAALRTSLRVEIAQLLRRLGATAIYVTHDQVEAMTVGHRIAVMQGGRIEQLGAPRAVYESPATAFVAGFLGTPPINLWLARFEGGVARLAGGSLPAPRGVHPSGDVLLAVRPEHVLVRPSDDPASSEGLSFVARVSATEPLGAETVLHAEVGGEPGGIEIRAKVSGFFDAALADEVRVRVAPEHVAWFDAATRRRLEATP